MSLFVLPLCMSDEPIATTDLLLLPDGKKLETPFGWLEYSGIQRTDPHD
jgi:hypothetical protein